MGRQRERRVGKVKHGYRNKKKRVRVKSEKEGVEKVVDRIVERGYRKGYRKEKEEGGKKSRRRVELGYTGKGTPWRQERKARSKPSRPRRVTSKERWGRTGGGGGRGTYRRQTTEGRKTGEEARKKELGGQRRLWVY